MKRFFMYITLVFAIGASGPKANNRINNPSNPKQIPDSIVVTANRKATPVKEIGSSVTIITETDIQKSQESSVAEILRTVPGLDVVQSGGAGKATSVFMRGANSHHTLVIIDGIEMNDPSSPNGAFDFAHLNSGNIQRIEILRGSQSVLYGSDAIGGVIQIFTKRGFGQPSFSFQSEAGSYSSFHESAIISGSNDKIDYSIFLSRKDSDGFSATADTSGTEENDGYENSEVAAHIGYNLTDKYELNLTGKYLDARSDIDNSWGIFEDPNYINKSNSKSMSISLENYVANDFWKPSFSILFSNHEFNSLNKKDDDHPDDASQYSSDGSKIKFSSLHTLDFKKNNHLTIGIETQLDKYESESFSESAWVISGDTVNEVDSRINSIFALEEISYNDRWFNTIGVRYDNHNSMVDSSNNEVTYRLTSTYIFDQIDLKIKANYGTGFKSPSLFQIYHESYGNPDLKAEESTNWEIGFEKQFKNMTFGATYFNIDFTNLIAFNASFMPVNIAEADSKGIELFEEFRFGQTTLRADYTYNEATNKIDNSQLIRRPKNKFTISGSHQFSDKLKLNAKLVNVGERNDTDFNAFPAATVVLDSYSLVNANMSYNIYSNLSVTGKIINLFDENYQEIIGYRTSKRAGYLGFNVKI